MHGRRTAAGPLIDHMLPGPVVGLAGLAVPGMDAALRFGQHPAWQLLAELGVTDVAEQAPLSDAP